MSKESVKVFISYAHKDEQLLKRLITHLKPLENDQLIKVWVDLEIKGGTPWHEEIQKHLHQSPIILLLISPDFLASDYIKKVEIPLALKLQQRKKARVVPVILSGESWKSNKDIASLNALPKNGKPITKWVPRESGFEDVAEGIRKIAGGSNNGARPPDVESNAPVYRNREDELHILRTNLINATGGDHFWVVIAGPQMGKTWLLTMLAKDLQEEYGWEVRPFDLEGRSANRFNDARQLLGSLFDLNLTGRHYKVVCNRVAQTIHGYDKSCLCILDSTEMLNQKGKKDLRYYLSGINEELDEIFDENNKKWLAFVAASRRPHLEWNGLSTDVRFAKLPLSQFKLSVIEEVLRDDQKQRAKDWYKKHAKSLLNVTEGLPALLDRYIKWLRDYDYANINQIDYPEVFVDIAQPYVREILLSEESLVTDDKSRRDERKNVLEAALLKLSPYRRLTESHLEHLRNEDKQFAANLKKLQWNIHDLWDAVKETHLTEPQTEQWLQIYTPIRRLLFRYHFAEAEAQSAAHSAAFAFYDSDDWWNEEMAGKPQSQLVLELLWHYVAQFPRPAPHYKPTAKVKDLLGTADRALARVLDDSKSAKTGFLDHLIAQLIDDSEMRITLGDELADKLKKHLERKRSQARHSPPKHKQ